MAQGSGSPNTATFTLFSDEGYTNVVETAKLGILGTCHGADAPFRSWKQSVGQNLFGRQIHFLTFTGNCSGVEKVTKLSNSGACVTLAGTGVGAQHSFKLRT